MSRREAKIYVTRRMRSLFAASAHSKLRALAKMTPEERAALIKLPYVRIQHCRLADPE